MSDTDNWVLYIVQCADGMLYTGITNDLDKRVKAHNDGRGAKYTRPECRRPVTLVYTQDCGTVSQAMREENRIKDLSRREKTRLIAQYAAAMQRVRDNKIEGVLA